MYVATGESVDRNMAKRNCDLDAITISCSRNEIPAFVGPELERLYGNLYSSLAQFRIYGNGHDTSTYIVRKGGTVITVFLFQLEGRQLRVLNQVIRIEEDEMTRFASYIFANFKSVSAISFEYIHTNIHRSAFPYQRINISEDIVLRLPDSVDRYLASMGKNTRRNIRRYTKKLLDTHPSFSLEVFEKNTIPGQAIRDIIALNRARMAGKNKVSAIDEIQTQQSIRLAQESGLVCIAKIDGMVCAGSISFQTGSNYFFSVIAHDSRYDDCCLGYLCSYRTICECIDRKGKEFHFLWGEYEYKYSLLGQKRALDKVTIYRSRAHFFFNGGLALRTAFEGWMRQTILWLHKTKRKDSLASRFAVTSLKFVRRLRRFKSEVLIVQKEDALG